MTPPTAHDMIYEQGLIAAAERAAEAYDEACIRVLEAKAKRLAAKAAKIHAFRELERLQRANERKPRW